MREQKIHNPGAAVEIVTLEIVQTERDQRPDLVRDWKRPEEEFDKGNRAWLPCTEAFLEEMNEVLPPLYPKGNANDWGYTFAVSEAWKPNARGEETFLWFREKPEPACRMASRREIDAERGN